LVGPTERIQQEWGETSSRGDQTDLSDVPETEKANSFALAARAENTREHRKTDDGNAQFRKSLQE